MSGHGGGSIIQDHAQEVGAVVAGVNEAGDSSMVESGVPDHSDSGLVETELCQTAQAAGDTGPGPHAVEGIEQLEPGGKSAETIAPDVPGDDSVPVVHGHRGFDGPERRPVRAAWAHSKVPRRDLCGQFLNQLSRAVRLRVPDPGYLCQRFNKDVRIHLSTARAALPGHFTGKLTVKGNVSQDRYAPGV